MKSREVELAWWWQRRDGGETWWGDGPDKSDAHVPSELGDAEDNDDEASANFSPERGRQRGGDAWSMRPDAGDGEIADAGIA